MSLALLLAPALLWLYSLASCLLASSLWWLCFTSSGSLTCCLLLHLLLHTDYWPLALAYGAFMAWDWNTCQRWTCQISKDFHNDNKNALIKLIYYYTPLGLKIRDSKLCWMCC